MMRYIFIDILVAIFILFPSLLWAEGEGIQGLRLAKAPIDYKNMESIKRGAKFFATNCMMCHTLTYLRYDPVAKEAGISTDKTPKNLMFNGIAPPDLSLEADARGVDWIYTYLHSFYQDKSRPSGANNLLVPNTAMPNQLAPYQGEQVLVEHPTRDLFGNLEWYDVVKLVKQGSMTPEQFDESTADLVNFLGYAAEPFRIEQERLGLWVLGFLVILFVMVYMLKNEYWKDVKRHKD
jgi:ubiquinol-cytochrome c reductase cytochrome c1 subunit